MGAAPVESEVPKVIPKAESLVQIVQIQGAKWAIGDATSEGLAVDRQVALWAGEASRHWWTGLTDEQRAEVMKLPPDQLFSLGFQCARANPPKI
jgi:hypothetical protein